MKRLIIWHNSKKNIYYYKVVKGYYVNYYVGYKNSYDHEVVLIIDDLIFQQKKYLLKKRLKAFIRFLDKKI